jgi:hypothetical protein
MRFFRKPLLIVIGLLLCSCTSASDKPSTPGTGQRAAQPGPAKGAPAIEITPNEPTRNSIVSASANNFNLSEATVVWLVNDAIVEGYSTSQFKASEASRGDMIQAKAVLKDQEIYSNTVQVKNTPPEIKSIQFASEVRPGDPLSIEAVGTDADGDAVTLLYEWTKNGEPAGTGKSIESQLKRDDSVMVKVTPFDGTDYGKAAVLQRKIMNMPPVILGNKGGSFDGSTYSYQVKASDPDGDALTYSLESPPAGMTIDPSGGLLKWVVPQEFKGGKNVTINVNDGNGGNTKYSITITIE